MMLVFVSYNVVIYITYGQLNSISASYYALPKKWNILFTLFCFGYAIPALMIATTGLMFFAGGFITFVGIAAAFMQDNFTSNMHTGSASIAIILSQLSIFFDYHMWWYNIAFLIIGGTLFLLRNKFKSWMYWFEVVAFACISAVFLTILLYN
jgi:hypothetical protein